MENMELYAIPSSPSLFHMLESEEDFPFGAKTTSFLPPATTTNAAASNTTATAAASYDLPEWMESQEILGLPNMTDSPLSLQASTAPDGIIFKLDEDNFPTIKPEDMLVPLSSPAIKPEDMLVPLSQLQPPHTPAINHLGLTPPATPPPALTPPATPPHTLTFPVSPPRALTPPVTPHIQTLRASSVSPAPAQANPPIPKIIICRKVTSAAAKSKPIQVNFQVLPAKQVPQITSYAQQLLPAASSPCQQSKKTLESQVGAMTFGGSQVEHQISSMAMAQPQVAPSAQASQTCDAEELIDEIVQMIGSSSSSTGGLQGLENVSFDASAMEASMEDLLSQLEASDSVTTSLDSEPSASSFLSPGFSSSVPAPSPQPSESSFSASLSALSPIPSEATSLASPAYLPSPVPSVGSLSPAPSSGESLYGENASCDDMKCLDEEWSPLEETHSYSRSQRKAKSSRRGTGARKTPYVEDRKERKKEQNKQAALRYRQKKKQEEDDLIEKIQAEEERQEKLKTKYSGLKQELSYLKKIMREVFIARGLLSEEALKKAALERKKSSK